MDIVLLIVFCVVLLTIYDFAMKKRKKNNEYLRFSCSKCENSDSSSNGLVCMCGHSTYCANSSCPDFESIE